jgi:hypothetical protein
VTFRNVLLANVQATLPTFDYALGQQHKEKSTTGDNPWLTR